MTAVPSLEQLLFAVQVTGWPPVARFGRLIHGEAGWRGILGGCPPPVASERVQILAALWRWLLVATAGGRAHLRCWLNDQWARPIVHDPAEPIRARLTRELPIYGDETLAPAILDAFCLAPRPVRDVVAAQCYVLAVGGRLRGWTSGELKTAGLYPIQVSGQSYAEVVSVMLHELAHVWNRQPPLAPGVVFSPTVTGWAEFLAVARRDGWPLEAAAARYAADERLAELCAMAWVRGGAGA